MSSSDAHVDDNPLLEGLNAPQREAVAHVDGPMVVVAGPGSGKTRVITNRIANLVLTIGIAPWNILAITFTNKAAGEMRDRVAAQLSEKQARAVTICTFHSLCARIIRQYADRLNLPPGYSIYDASDQKSAMKQALSDLEVREQNFPPSRALASISNAKNELIDAETFAANAADFYDKSIARLYKRYQQILTNNNALDFDDLLMRLVELLRGHRDVLEQLRQRWQYLLIDEYQDTNHVQFVIANLLAAEHRNICVTGDPDQSIYRWRGADIRNILDFESHYPDAKVVRLEQNYRSTRSILGAADHLIRNNSRRRHKELWTDNEGGEAVEVVRVLDEQEEADRVVRFLSEQHDEHDIAWRDMAIFYRTNHLSRVIEEALRKANLPYQIARGTAFYDRAEIKNAVAYMRAIANPADAVNLLRIINTPARGISDRTVKMMQTHSVEHDVPIDRLLHEPQRLTNLNTRAVNAIRAFADTLDGWRREAGFDTGGQHADAPSGLLGERSLRGLVEHVLRDSTLEEYYRNDKSDPDAERLMNLGELVSSAQQFEEQFDFEHAGESTTVAQKLEGWLEQISLVSDIDAVDSSQGAITLMTLHAAKGLEFPVVAILAVEDGLLPHSRSNSDDDELEEERRLMFVGITRAKRRLLITHATQRTVFGRTEASMPSRFLRELPEEHVEIIDEADESLRDWTRSDRRQRDALSQRASAMAGQEEFPAGCTVEHAHFGVGKVLRVSAAGAHTRAQVQFRNAGVKTLILQYANLQRLD